MKRFYILLFLFLSISISVKSQLPADYPFKTFTDSDGSLYLTGDTSISGSYTNIIITKYDNVGRFKWSQVFENSNGFDIGMDIMVQTFFPYNVLVTGLLFDSLTNGQVIFSL